MTLTTKDRRLIAKPSESYTRPEPLVKGGGKRTDAGKPTKRQLAEKHNPDFDWKAYDEAMSIAAKVAASNLNNKSRDYRDTRTEEEKQMASATIDQGKALILAESPYDDYKSIVDAAYAKSGFMTEASCTNLARLAHNYGLNPSPGLDLIYAWVDQNGKLNFHISYKAWLAIAHRYRKFLISHREITEPAERNAHGLKAGDVGFITEMIPLDITESLKAAKEAGFDVQPKQFAIVGVGIARSGDTPPKGRSIWWLARKRSIKDAALLSVADKFNLAAPALPDMYYDHENDSWVSLTAIEGSYTVSTPDNVVEPDYAPEQQEDVTEQAESTNGTTPETQTAGEQAADTTPQTDDDPKPASTENAGKVREASESIEDLQKRFDGILEHFEKTDQRANVRISKPLAEEKTAFYNVEFRVALELDNDVDAATYREAFTNRFLKFVGFGSIDRAKYLTLDKWYEDRNAARKEIRMFRAWWDAQQAAKESEDES